MHITVPTVGAASLAMAGCRGGRCGEQQGLPRAGHSRLQPDPTDPLCEAQLSASAMAMAPQGERVKMLSGSEKRRENV